MNNKHTPAPWFHAKRVSEPLIYTERYGTKVALPNTESNLSLIISSPEMYDCIKAVLLNWKNLNDEHFTGASEKLKVLCEKAVAKAEGNLFWTYELDGEIYDAEFETRAKADEWAQERYAESLEDEPMRNGDTFSRDDYALIEFSYDEEGERVIHEREDSCLEYEHYHGDLKEHGYP